MIVDKRAFDAWLMDNFNSTTTREIPTPQAKITTYSDDSGKIVASIAQPVDGSAVVYEVK